MDNARQGYTWWAYLGFALYGLACLVVFIIVQFPYDMLRERIEQSLSGASGLKVELGHLSGHLPLRLLAEGVRVNSTPVFTRVSLRPGLAALLSARVGGAFRAELDDGRMWGSVGAPWGGSLDPLELSVHLEGVNLASLAGLLALPGGEVRGIAQGDMACLASLTSLDKTTGRVSLRVAKGQLPLAFPGLPLDAVAFEEIDLSAHMDKGLLTIDAAEMKGDISGSLKGRIRVRSQIASSRLNLTGQVQLPPAMMALMGPGAGGRDDLNFSIGGTVDNPRFRLLRR